VYTHPEVDELAKREYKILIPEERGLISLVFDRRLSVVMTLTVLDGGMLLYIHCK
jgi:hypothetical protein